MNSKYNYNDAQVPEPKYDTDTANKYYVDKVAKQLSGDIEGDISGISADIATKSKNYTSAPNPPYNVGDTYMNGDDIYICITARGYGSFTQSDWKKASKYDNTKSILDGGVTTDGTLVVARGGTVAAGLTAYTEGDEGVRLWAGSTINGINSAPFRVLQNGSVFMTKANITGGTIKLHSNTVDNIMFKAYLDGYEDNVYAAIYPSTLALKNNDNYCSMGFGLGQPAVEVSKVISSTENHVSQMFPDFICVMKQLGGNQIITKMSAEEVETPKIVAGNMDCGTCTLNSSSDTTISFNKTFTSPPIVVLTPIVNRTAVGACYSGSVVSTTTTNFKAYCLTNLNSSGNITFNWIAIGA